MMNHLPNTWKRPPALCVVTLCWQQGGTQIFFCESTYLTRLARHLRLRHFLPPHHVVECPLCGAHVKVVQVICLISKYPYLYINFLVACFPPDQAAQKRWRHEKITQVDDLGFKTTHGKENITLRFFSGVANVTSTF